MDKGRCEIRHRASAGDLFRGPYAEDLFAALCASLGRDVFGFVDLRMIEPERRFRVDIAIVEVEPEERREGGE